MPVSRVDKQMPSDAISIGVLEMSVSLHLKTTTVRILKFKICFPT